MLYTYLMRSKRHEAFLEQDDKISSAVHGQFATPFRIPTAVTVDAILGEKKNNAFGENNATFERCGLNLNAATAGSCAHP